MCTNRSCKGKGTSLIIHIKITLLVMVSSTQPAKSSGGATTTLKKIPDDVIVRVRLLSAWPWRVYKFLTEKPTLQSSG